MKDWFLFLLGLLLGQKHTSASEESNAQHKQTHIHPERTVAELSTPVPISVKAETHEQKDKWEQAKTIFEMIGVGLVLFYVCFTYRIMRDANNTLLLNRLTSIFRSTSGPGLVSLKLIPRLRLRTQMETFVTAKFRNTGKTPALKVVVQIYMQEQPPGQRPDFSYPRPLNAPSGIVMPNAQVMLRSGRVVPISAIKDQRLILFHYGSVWYCDVFHKEHRSDFCSAFDPRKGFFTVCSFHEEVDRGTMNENCK